MSPHSPLLVVAFLSSRVPLYKEKERKRRIELGVLISILSSVIWAINPRECRAGLRSIVLIIEQGFDPLPPSPNLSWRQCWRIWWLLQPTFLHVEAKSTVNTPPWRINGSIQGILPSFFHPYSYPFFPHPLLFYLLCSLPNQIWLPTAIYH